MLRRCKKGHLTGYRHCGTCESDTVPYDWLHAVLAPAPPRCFAMSLERLP
jgi:hypothetical protein